LDFTIQNPVLVTINLKFGYFGFLDNPDLCRITNLIIKYLALKMFKHLELSAPTNLTDAYALAVTVHVVQHYLQWITGSTKMHFVATINPAGSLARINYQ